jgi:FkbM family methyltransferase
MFLLRLKKLFQIVQDPRLISALLKGTAAGMEHARVLENLDCEYVVDVGANRGQFALVTRKVFPKARILSFEPLAEPVQNFKSIFAQDPLVTLYPFAVGCERTTAAIHITKDDDSSSLLPVMKIQSDLFPGAVERGIREIAVYPLSDILDPASIPPGSLLKIDVQGYELDVLRGCGDILHKFSHLYVECSFMELYEGQALAHQVIAWLQERGFVLWSVHNLYYARSGLAVQGDFLFSQNANVHGRQGSL